MNSDKKKKCWTLSRLDIIKAVAPYLAALAVIAGAVLLISYLPDFILDKITDIIAGVGMFAWLYTLLVYAEKISEKFYYESENTFKPQIFSLLIIISMWIAATKMPEL